MASEIKGRITGEGRRCAIVVGRFNELVTERLLVGAREALEQHGVAPDDITVVWVPGAFELPLTCRWIADTGAFDAIVALGAVIRGETSHYEHVCNQAARGILDAAVDSGTPIGFGVLTCDDREQALARSEPGSRNKGADAALAALEMLSIRTSVHDHGR